MMLALRSATQMLEMFARYRLFVHAFIYYQGRMDWWEFLSTFRGHGVVKSAWRFACIKCGKYPSLTTFNYMVID